MRARRDRGRERGERERKRYIILIKPVVKFAGKSRYVGIRGRSGEIRKTKTSDKKPISSRIQGHVMNAKTKGLEM